MPCLTLRNASAGNSSTGAGLPAWLRSRVRWPTMKPARAWQVRPEEKAEEIQAWWMACWPRLLYARGQRLRRRTPRISARCTVLARTLSNTFRSSDPRDVQKSYIKRVIAVPGDRLRIDHGRVFVNGHALSEPYIPAEYRDERSLDSMVVPQGEYFVMGDHRSI